MPTFSATKYSILVSAYVENLTMIGQWLVFALYKDILQTENDEVKTHKQWF